jgi:hypothetical protein
VLTGVSVDQIIDHSDSLDPLLKTHVAPSSVTVVRTLYPNLGFTYPHENPVSGTQSKEKSVVCDP